MDRDKIEYAKALFRRFDKYPTTKDEEESRVFLGGLDGKEYWQAYNEHYKTNHPLPIETVRNAG